MADKIIFLWLSIINAVGFLMMGIDKYKAKRKKWRISEAALFTVAIIGGAVGSYIGMQIFRHKTKHKSFAIGIPLIILVHVALATWFWV